MAISKCPVCGKQYTDLDKLAECVKADNLAMKRVEAQKAADEARKKAEEAAAATALRDRYIKAIKDSRTTVERSFETFKTQIAAYNKLIEEAKTKTGIIASHADASLSFGNVKTSYSAQKLYDWLDQVEQLIGEVDKKTQMKCTNPSVKNTKCEDTDDLATVIFKSLGI